MAIPTSLYVHLPWCVRKCPYCDFNSHASNPDAIPEEAYLAALQKDLTRDVAELETPLPALQSIFFGGGTPSLFSAAAIADIINMAERTIGLQPDCEITMEANPGTFEQHKFSDFRRAGVNRLSIGIQSFNNSHLQRLGRIHNGDEALCAVDIARRAGFDNLNLDLMHGLPNQSEQDALQDLKTALNFNPEHLSWYQLTIEPNSEFYSNPPNLPDDDILDDIFLRGQELLADAGFTNYEVSAHSKPNKASQHNLNYWQFGDYLGIGAGAHGKLTDTTGKVWRTQKSRAPQHYMNPDNLAQNQRTRIDGQQLIFEFMLNALRLRAGVASELFTQRTQLPLQSIEAARHHLVKAGLLSDDPLRIATTERGALFLNTVLEQFLPD